MNVIVSGKSLKVTEALRAHAEEKIEAIQRYFDHIIEADVTLSIDRKKEDAENARCDVTVWANGTILKSSEHKDEMYAAINGAVHKIERQLKKYKQKIREHPKRKTQHALQAGTGGPPTVHHVIKPSTSAKAGPKIIRTHSFAMKPMSVDEAAMQLQALNQEFVMFSNSETNEVNVVYKRHDGNIGLIEPGEQE
jgi:putative sigma-54 modulation protein